MAYCCSACMLSISTGRSGNSARIDGRRSMPLRRPKEMSRMTTSKASRRSAGRTASPSHASPATVQPARSAMICWRPRRTMLWSSAIRIFIGNADEKPGAPGRNTLENDVAAERENALADADEAEGGAAAHLLVGDAPAVVAHLRFDGSVAPFDANVDAARAGVPGHVGQRFLNDAIERSGARRIDGNVLGDDAQRDRGSGAPREVLHLLLDGR